MIVTKEKLWIFSEILAGWAHFIFLAASSCDVPGIKSVDSPETSWVWFCADVLSWGCRGCCEESAWD